MYALFKRQTEFNSNQSMYAGYYTYLRIPKMGAQVVALLAKLERQNLTHCSTSSRPLSMRACETAYDSRYGSDPRWGSWLLDVVNRQECVKRGT